MTAANRTVYSPDKLLVYCYSDFNIIIIWLLHLCSWPLCWKSFSKRIALFSSVLVEETRFNVIIFAAGIGLHVNAHKTEYMGFNQTGDISTLDRNSLKLVDKITYQRSSVSSTEKDINTRLTKAWTAIDKLSIIWKSDWPIKWNAVSSKQRSYRYCYMDALLGRKQNSWRKS